MSSPEVVRFYGRRKGHDLKPGRQRLVIEALPFLRLPDEIPQDLPTLFAEPVRPRLREIWLEIGFGAGEHLVHQAQTHPDVGFIGAEPYINGVAALVAGIEANDIKTVRIFDEDARLLLPRLPDASIARLFLLFPDPWHKARHNKRRFVSPETLDHFARILKPGGEFRFASDDAGYVRWTLARTVRHPDFVWTAQGPDDWRTRPADAIATRYEIKNITRLKPVYLTFRRR
jgi:tRNA (guanine-N7-)-methyltransferase